jgi:hypothetical protein
MKSFFNLQIFNFSFLLILKKLKHSSLIILTLFFSFHTKAFASPTLPPLHCCLMIQDDSANHRDIDLCYGEFFIYKTTPPFDSSAHINENSNFYYQVLFNDHYFNNSISTYLGNLKLQLHSNDNIQWTLASFLLPIKDKPKNLDDLNFDSSQSFQLRITALDELDNKNPKFTATLKITNQSLFPLKIFRNGNNSFFCKKTQN